MELENIKTTIESWNKNNQIEILKIIKNTSTTKINENKSGVYINMNFLSDNTLEQIRKYIAYVKDQETILSPFESQKEDFKNTFFYRKEHKDEMIYNVNEFV
jgi:hypothetical protein